jgi:phage tail sheath protein FI
MRIQNFGDYTANFGGLLKDSEVSYAVQQFFLNGGTDAYVVRVAKGAAQAQVTLQNLPSPPAPAAPAPQPTNVLTVSAFDPGAWGNYVELEVDYLTSNPDSYFNLTVTEYQLQNGAFVQVAQEQFRNLSMNTDSSNYVPNVINAGSSLIQVTIPVGLLPDAGWALSGDLTTLLANLKSADNVISGLLDSTTPFTLVLTGVLPPLTPGALLTAVTNSIGTAGLGTQMAASLTDAIGQAATGSFLKLTSLQSPTTDSSSVQITAAPSNNVAAKIKLGLVNGGREKEGASILRPAPTGTTGADLAAVFNTSTTLGAMIVTVTDRGTGSVLYTGTTAPLPATNIDSNLPGVLQTLIQALGNPAVKQASVRMFGSSLNILPSASTPNASIALTGALGTELFANACENVQQYNLGVGATFSAQQNAIPGKDGTPPGAAEFEGDGAKTGIYALRDVDLFNLLVIPRTTQLSGSAMVAILDLAMALCEERRAFMIIDPDPAKGLSTIAAWVSSIDASKNAAVFFPRILIADPLDNFRLHPMPSSGAIAGVFARTDAQRGVWKAPAGIDAVIQGAQGLSYTLTDDENGQLNPQGINCLRTFPVYGTVVWGARTLLGNDAQANEWKYSSVRRTALYIEESLFRGTKWVVFEPNDEPLWAQIRLNVGAFMQNLFRQHAFQGSSPQQAYFVKCDKETTTQNDINLGIVNILVGFAPLKPAEFVVIQIQQMAGQVTA